MTGLSEVKEAIISIKDGTLHITFGQDINNMNAQFHNEVSFEMNDDGKQVILARGSRIQTAYFSETVTEKDKNFDFYCENLTGFKEKIETKKVLKFW